MKQFQRNFNAISTLKPGTKLRKIISLFFILATVFFTTTIHAQPGETGWGTGNPEGNGGIGTGNGCAACSNYYYYNFKDGDVCVGDWWGMFTVMYENVRIVINISTSNNNNYDIIGHASPGYPFYYYPNPADGVGSRKFKITCYDTKGTSDPQDDVKIGECTFYKTLSFKYGTYANFTIKDNGENFVYESRGTGVGSPTVDSTFCYPEELFLYPFTPHPSVDCQNATFIIEYVETDQYGYDIQVVGTEVVRLGPDDCPDDEGTRLKNFSASLEKVSPLNYLAVRFTTTYEGCTNSHEVRFKVRTGVGYPINLLVSDTIYERRKKEISSADSVKWDMLKWKLITEGYPYSVADFTIPASENIITTGFGQIVPIIEEFRGIQGIESIDVRVYQYDYEGATAELILEEGFSGIGFENYAVFNLNNIKQVGNFFGMGRTRQFFIWATLSMNSGSYYYYNKVPTRFYELQIDINSSCGTVSGSQLFNLDDNLYYLPENSNTTIDLISNLDLRSADSKHSAELQEIRYYNLQGQLIKSYNSEPNLYSLESEMGMGIYIKFSIYTDGSTQSSKVFIR